MRYDAIVVGGGFYGTTIAAHLAEKHGFSVVLFERLPALHGRASANNQARVHNGYHYPRSFTTAFRSRVNLSRFVRDWSSAIDKNFTNLYAIARKGSRVTAKQFTRFCKDIGADLEVASPSLKQLFEPRLIEEVFVAQEFTFNHEKLTELTTEKLRATEVQLLLNRRVIRVEPQTEGSRVWVSDGGNVRESYDCRFLFNCTYSGLGHLEGVPPLSTGMKHEIAEIALVEAPEPLRSLGVTVMDGPFFSVMPFPARNQHTLSHVRYTPHLSWTDSSEIEPYAKFEAYPRESRYDRMVRDAARYLPAIGQATFASSLFEVRTVLEKNEIDDGRPILFEKHRGLRNCFSILGGKIDNVYDVLERLENELSQ